MKALHHLLKLTLAVAVGTAVMGCAYSTIEKSSHKSVFNQADMDAKLFNASVEGAHVLVFSKTAGWRHTSIEHGVLSIQKLAKELKFSVEATENADIFTDQNLSRFNAIIFLNTTGDILNPAQEHAMERFIQSGGGYVGIHAAADTEAGEWYWYRKLVGGLFRSHPGNPDNVQRARLDLINPPHPATAELEESKSLIDEWYDYISLYPYRQDLIRLDERSYQGGLHGDYHPITWYHHFDGGRAFYTGLGHTDEIFDEPYFKTLITRGIRFAVGGKPERKLAEVRPYASEWKQAVRATLKGDQRQFAVKGSNIFSLAADGVLTQVNAENSTQQWQLPLTNLAQVTGLAVLSPAEVVVSFIDTTQSQQLVSVKLSAIKAPVMTSIVSVPNANICCSVGGAVAVDGEGRILFAVGDHAQVEEQETLQEIIADALTKAANPSDLRGKILRFQLSRDGQWLPANNNLFTDEQSGHAAIYAMGVKNPNSIRIDTETDTVYFSDRGLATGTASYQHAPVPLDELNRLDQAANFGWPMVTGNNISYVDTKASDEKRQRLYNPRVPKVQLANEAEMRILPEAKPALIWYGDAANKDFPEVGEGARHLRVIGVFPAKAGSYYHGKLAFMDIERQKLFAAKQDAFGRVTHVETIVLPLIDETILDATVNEQGALIVFSHSLSAGQKNIMVNEISLER